MKIVNLERNGCHTVKYTGWALIVPVSSDSVLKKTLLRSPDIVSGCELILQRQAICAGLAYNAGISVAHSELIIFAHQDVYLPDGWIENVRRAIGEIERKDLTWGVLGVYGIDTNGHHHGFVHSTGLKRTLGHPFRTPIEVRCLDELVLIIRRSAGLRFDEALPGFHLYGADLCLQANDRGFRNYVIPALCVHNSRGITTLPVMFWKCYFYLRRKWKSRLPVVTPCTVIRARIWSVIRVVLGSYRGGMLRVGKVGTRVDDPSALYHDLVLPRYRDFVK